jgi:serine/threonine-protein kinase RsbW
MVDYITLDLPADLKYLSLLGACIVEFVGRVEDVAEAESVAYNVQLAVNEIFTNIVVHAYQRDASKRVGVRLALNANPRKLHLSTEDTGRVFDPDNVAQPELEVPQEHGYGLFLAKQLMDVVDYQAGPDKNRWTLEKNL